MPFNYEQPQVYNGGKGNYAPQLEDFYFDRKALIDLRHRMYFTPLADSISMPAHYGQTIKKYHYIPLLDDRNINDQGIDATGASTANEVTITLTDPSGGERYGVGEGTDATTALTAAQKAVHDMLLNLGIAKTDYAADKAALEAAGWTVVEGEAVCGAGNLYGSSKDVGTIADKLPILGESGGRVNRVGWTRLTLEGSIQQMGFFEEYTEDSVQFDTDAQLRQHISNEAMRGANEIYEAKLQSDLLNAANTVFYGGTATSMSELTGDTSATVKSTLDYSTLVHLDTMLNNLLCPKDTKMITGTNKEDTKTIASARYAFIGPELKVSLLKMKNFHNEPAFIPVQQYGAAATIANGEIGSIDHFRFIENPNMQIWKGQGAAVTDNAGYYESNGHYDVFPMLVIGDSSFTTIGFNTSKNGGGAKWIIKHKKPGLDVADHTDPYGKTGFWSIAWWYGFLAYRPEWIACVKVVAER